MKKRIRLALSAIAFTIILSACKKDKDSNPGTDNNNFPTQISGIAPQSMIDSIRNIGAMVYGGTSPAIVNGTYLMTPDSCVYDNSPANFKGTLFTDYKFRFSSQDNGSYTITVEQKAVPSNTLSPTPVSTYISGNGNDFSIFILRTTSPSGVPVQQFNVLSGTFTASGIQNLQNILYLRSKGSDPGNTLPPAGTIRRFVTGRTGLAANTTF